MLSLDNKLPHYLLGKNELIVTVVFTAFFSLFLLIVSIPFSNNAWFKIEASEAFSFTVIFLLIALCIVILSKTLLYRIGKKRDISYGYYIIWNLTEVFSICLLYSFFTLKCADAGIIKVQNSNFLFLLGNSLLYAFMSLVVPYILAGMYHTIQDKNNTIRLMNYGNVVTDAPISAREEQKITLFDNSGVMKLSVSVSNLYYIESDDNYIKVWYSDSLGVLKQYMLRCRLKTVEESFRNSELIRCHRKYIVNMLHVKIISKMKDGYVMELDADVEPIPITKTYEESVLSRFNSR